MAVRDQVTGPLVDSLFLGCRFRKTLANGLRFDFTHTGRISREFILSAEHPDHVWEPQTTRLLLHFAAQAEHAIVGGAYFGDQALLMAHAMRAHGGQVHAFEPGARQHADLVENAHQNDLHTLFARAVGLWSRPGVRLRFDGADELASPSEAPPVSDPETVPTTTVDACLAERGIAHLDLLMIDVEGGEQSVLQGARHQLERPAAEAPVVVFETNSRYSDWSQGLAKAETCVFLAERGYHLYAIRDHHANFNMQGRPVELIPVDRTFIEGPPHGFNMLAIKNPERLNDPLFRLVQDVSPKLLPHKGDRRFEPVHDHD
ncbi:MAG: FkbM family methyltransferase [Verrucomicrobiaceae bacterium]